MRHSISITSALARKTAIALLSLGLSLAAAVQARANSKYAAIVIDANTGKTLHESSADQLRYPASLTKMMTIYMLFEGLASGKLKKTTRIPVSAYAAARPPSKLGLKAGQSVTVETAIYALVTKSANDVASAVGEFIGGSEEGFGRIATAKARALGMSRTTFRNPHGLPNPSQVTTARDMARLGLALREHYPQYYSYFSTRSFTYGKRRMGNHNKLLGRVEGVDGIKTGYTRASGFNLVSSVKSGNRRIVAVVLGGTSGASRNAQMTALIRKYMPAASTGSKGQLIARTKATPLTVASVKEPVQAKASVVARVSPTANVPVPSEKPLQAEMSALATAPTALVDPVRTASVSDVKGWVIQVASLPTHDEALSVIARTKSKAGPVLAKAQGFASTFEKDGTLYYRARFAGFSGKDAAWKACAALKRQKIGCYASQQ